VLGNFLGLDYEVEVFHENFIEITQPESTASQNKLTLDATFFIQADCGWLTTETMPSLPLLSWCPREDCIDADLVEPHIPVLYGYPGLDCSLGNLHLNLDIFGSCFFMLSRYEELITNVRDSHNRFPATASVAYKESFLHRPLVNEYVEILWSCLIRISPQLSRKKRVFKKHISCDVDHPIDVVGYSLYRTVLRVCARIIRDRKPKIAILDLANYFFKKFGSDRFDEYRNNIFWIMDVNKQAGNKVAFYFIPLQTDSSKEDPSDVRSKKNSKLLRHIVDSGHEVGMHPGYQTYNHALNFQRSSAAFKQALHDEDIDFKEMGGRQHYLMYDVSKTPQLWEANGFHYDSSLGFADRAGFRCGVCYEYQMYDLVNRTRMQLIQRPLVLMETTLLAYENLNFDGSALHSRIRHFEKVIRSYKGDFTLLWHNSSLPNNQTYKTSIG
jgi:hypothetical protein